MLKKSIEKISSSEYNGKIVIADLTRRLTWGDSRMFFFTSEFYYDYWLPQAQYINEPNKIFFEHALARAIHTLLARNDRQWAMLPLFPVTEGYSGTHGKKYPVNIFHVFFRQAFHSVKRKMFATSK